MPIIRETVITTAGADGSIHVAPMGVTVEADQQYVIAPFRPSRTLDNLLAARSAVINHTDDVRVFAGCISGRKRDWPTGRARVVPAPALLGALSHEEVEVVDITDDEMRPRLTCRVVHTETCRPFRGFNRAQAAVIEAAILVSRLHLLPADKIDQEINYLSIAIAKTAGPVELEAWQWLMDRIRRYRAEAGTA